MAMESGHPTVGVPAIGKRPLVTELLLRVCVSIITVISLSLIASNKNFDTQPAFNYLLATAILAFLYSAAQSVINVYHLAACGPSLLANAAYIYFSIAADLVCCLLLMSGSSAAFGVTTGFNYTDNFVAQANGSASLALIAFFLMLPLVALSGQRYYLPS
ncbi:hypothetical protein L7F22_015243 [Adiantum nelumboides]|nr:hypothetical protein [Adiantum nelumboides]